VKKRELDVPLTILLQENTEMLLCAEFNAMVSGETVDIRL
jgi:hypothetical protein